MGWDASMDMGVGMSMDQNLCRCGNPKAVDEALCVRCAYYQRVFSPPTPVFESRKERALKAIADRKLMRGASKVMRIE